MKRGTIIICGVLIAGCGGKKNEATSCESVAKHLVEVDAGDKATFMTDKERASRAKRWIATCEPMSEATRKCVLAAKTMEEADACAADGSAGSATTAAGAKAAWVVRAGDASDQDTKFVALAADGDVIAAGDFNGTLDLGEQAVKAQSTDAWVARLSPTGTVRWVKGFGGAARDYVSALHVDAEGNIVLTLTASEDPRFSRVVVAADGTATSHAIAVEQPVHAAALDPKGDVVVGSRAIEPVKGSTCGAMSFVVQRFAADGTRQWSRCNDGKEKVRFTNEPMNLATGPDGSTAVCAGFTGALAWGGRGAPDGDENDRAFVLVLDAKGETRWVSYIVSTQRGLCDALAVTDDGSVVASVRGVIPGPALKMWDADGQERWTRSCSELLGETKECELSAVTAKGSDIVIAAESGSSFVIVTIDGKTGATKQAHKFDRARIESLALASHANDVVFAGGFSGTANFGTGPVMSTEGNDGDSTTDVLIGRL